MGGEKLKWRQLAHQFLSQQKPHFSHHSKAKANIKAQISGKLVSSGISDVAFVSVSTEKTRMKKCWIMIIIIMKKIAINDGFCRAPEIDFRF